MSMILGLEAVSDATIARLLAEPALIWRLIAPDDPEPYAEATRPRGSLLARLFGKAAPAPAAGVPPAIAPEGPQIDLDKAWHGIHYLLTGTADGGKFPHNFLLLGGREVGDVDVGYEPARAMTSQETAAAAAMLAGQTDDALRARFDAPDMMRKQIYPEIWDRDPEEDDALGYLMENVDALRRLLDAAARDGLGIVLWTS